MSGDKIVLHDYQQEAVDCFKKLPQMLLTLPPGAGKSYILFSVIKYPALVITYKYVIAEQIYQLATFNPDIKTQHIATGKTKIEPGKDIYYITPQLLIKKIPEISKLKLRFLVVDESQMLKNPKSRQTKSALMLPKLFPKACKMCMSGTPAPESILDMYPQIQFVSNCRFPDWDLFVAAYASREKMLWGGYREYATKKQQKVIEKVFSRYVFNKDKSELPLPEQTIHEIPLTMPKKLRKLYDNYLDELYIEIEKDGCTEGVLANSSPYNTSREIAAGFITTCPIEKTKEKLCDSKYHYAKEIADSSDSQVIIWGNFRWELEMMHEVAGKDSRLLYGGTKKGDKIIEDFKVGKFKMLVANPMCIGAGVSLQNCHRMIYLTTPVKASSAVQSLSRTNRVNQKEQEHIYYLFYVDTIEEVIANKTKKKITNQKKILKAIREYLQERRKVP